VVGIQRPDTDVPPPTEEPPSLETLTAALKPVIRAGLPLSPNDAPDELLALRGVYARSTYVDSRQGRTKALNQLLVKLLVDAGDSDSAEAVRHLFAVSAGSRGTPLTRRRTKAYELLGYSERHFRKHIEPKMLADVAWLLHQDSQTYTPRSRKSPPRMAGSGDTPTLTPADISEHEELVSRIWARVYELRAELIRDRLGRSGVATAARGDDAPSDIAMLVVGHLLLLIDKYLDKHGESILHGEAQYEVAGLIRLAGWRGDLSEHEIRAAKLRGARQ
jgi:hypothetical protein